MLTGDRLETKSGALRHFLLFGHGLTQLNNCGLQRRRFIFAMLEIRF
jgi:hypothetical protein